MEFTPKILRMTLQWKKSINPINNIIFIHMVGDILSLGKEINETKISKRKYDQF